MCLEWCGTFCGNAPWEKTIREVGNDRLVFGSDAMGHDWAWELGRLLSLEVEEEVLRPILGANMRAILARKRN